MTYYSTQFKMNIKTTADGFNWLVLTEKQAMDTMQDINIEVFLLHDDDGESLAECFNDILEHGGEYKRSVDDYMQLCPSCHRKFDMGKLTLNQIQNGEL